jgi:hypothetical protein
MQMLFSLACLTGSLHVLGYLQVLPGIYTHGYVEVQSRIDDGRIPPEDTMWFYQYSGWGPGQLENECQHGVWLTVATSADLLIEELTHEKGTLWKDLMSHIDGAMLLLVVANQGVPEGALRSDEQVPSKLLGYVVSAVRTMQDSALTSSCLLESKGSQ